MKTNSLNETNFRDYAQKIIAKYNEKNMFLDAMLWAQVIGYYEKSLTEAATQHDRPNGEE